MKFNIGDKVRVYGPLFGLGSDIILGHSENPQDFFTVSGMTGYECGNLILTHLQYQPLDGREFFYAHPKQCRKLKKKVLTKHDFEIGEEVIIKPSWSDWVCNHIDVFFIEDNVIPDRHKKEVATHMLLSLEQQDLRGIVTGYGNDDSVKVSFTWLGFPGDDETKSTYMEISDLKKISKKKEK